MLWSLEDTNPVLLQEEKRRLKQHEDDNRHLLQISQGKPTSRAIILPKVTPQDQMYPWTYLSCLSEAREIHNKRIINEDYT